MIMNLLQTNSQGKQRFIAAAAMLLFCTLTVVAQNLVVKGTVKDKNGDPIIGATVRELGTSNGVATDIDGNYELPVSKANATLTVSYIG